MDATVTFKDGSTHIYKGVPDGTAPDVVEAQATKEFNKPVASLSGGASAVAPPTNQPSAHPRWDILGDIGRAGSAAWDAAKSDIKTAFPGQAALKSQMDNDVSKYGMVGAEAKDLAINMPRRMGNLLKAPVDALGIATAPVTGTIHALAGSALSYALPVPAKGMDAGGGQFYQDSKDAADKILDQGMLGLGPEGMAAGPEALASAGQKASAASAVQQAARTDAILKNKAISKVNARAKADGITAQQVIDAQTAARANGDKVTLMDLGDKNVRGLAGAVYRAPGPAGKAIGDFLDIRDASAADGLAVDVKTNVASGSTYSAEQALLKARSEAAGPAYKEALAADSTAPLEQQFRNQLIAATGNKGQIARQMADIEANNPGALAARGAAGADVRAKYMDLHQQLQDAEGARQAIQAKFQRAQQDKTANAPGAVWSPRLQQFLDHPEVQSGLRAGLKMEKQDAIADGRLFNDSDFSIVDHDDAGNPIVGEVPTMKSLAVAKEGLDAKISEMRDPVTGRPTKAGLSLKKFRDAFLSELDTLNPRYKAARDAWSGPSQSMDAMRDGRDHFSRPDSNEQIKSEFDSLSPGDKEFYRLGAAESKIDAVERAPDASDKSKRVINSERDRKRFRMLFDSDQQANDFVASVARKRAAFETKTSIKGGSATAGRVADDANEGVPLALDAVGAVGHGVAGNFLGAANAALRIKRELGLRNNPALNSEIAKILMDHNLQAGGASPNLFEGLPVPARRNYVGNTLRGMAATNPLRAITQQPNQ